MTPPPTAALSELSRRRVLQILGLGAAGTAVGAACGPSQEAEQNQTASFHGAYPYQAPPKGHFNIMNGVTESILGGNPYTDLFASPSAMYLWADKKYVPILAEEWNLDTDNNTFTLTLKEGMRWSDDKPVTSKDVLSTFWCLRLMRNVAWNYLASVEAEDDRTVVFTMNNPSTVVERYVLRQCLYSDATYGEWAGRVQEIFDGGSDLDSPEGTKLNEDFQAFRPEQVIASGPFDFDYDSITNARLTLVKNDKGYNADTVAFDEVVVFNGEVPDVTPVVLQKQVDYATHGFPIPTENQFVDSGFRILRPPVYSGPALLFNMERFPEFADVRARRALAYAIDREANGTVSLADSGKGVVFMCGLSDNLVPDWLSEEEQGQLEPYDHDPARAEQMLTDAGWTKQGERWHTPEGNPAEYELSFPAEFADWSASGRNVAEQLNAFGFAIKPQGVNHIQHPIDVDKGSFELAIRAWGSSNHPHPHFSFSQDLFTHNIPLAANQGGKGMAFELVQETDAFGEIDLEKAVVEAGQGLDEAAQRANVARVAIAYNELLPAIPLFERYGNNPALEGERVESWPPDDDPILQNAPYADNFTIMLILDGRLKPVSTS